jgi:hypothetical protein
MRREDIEKLGVPYPESGVLDERFGNALGVTPSAVRELQREVFGDFDEKVGGVGWWAPHPGTSRRILISDHLLQCIASIETNLVEARLHLLETSISTTERATSTLEPSRTTTPAALRSPCLSGAAPRTIFHFI